MYSKVIAEDLQSRWSRIFEMLNGSGCDALFISSTANIIHSSSRVFSGYIVFIAGESAPRFFVKRPVGLEGDNVTYIRKPEDIVAQLPKKVESVMLELDITPYNEVERYKNMFVGAEVHNGSGLLRTARSIKSPYEISLIRKSAVQHAKCYDQVTALYKEGMSDIDLSIEVERLFRKEGSLGIFRVAGSSMEIFMGSIIAGGDNADSPSPYDFAMGGAGLDSSLPVGCDGTIINEGMSVMVDVGGNFTGYMTDMTRVFARGEISELAKKAHNVSLMILAEIEKVAKAGTAAADLYKLAIEIVEREGVADYFMGHRQKAGFIGHGIGIEINELPVLAPRSRDTLQEGMVFAIEPKFVIPGTGAVGVENSYLVTATGVEKLTLFEESIMNL